MVIKGTDHCKSFWHVTCKFTALFGAIVLQLERDGPSKDWHRNHNLVVCGTDSTTKSGKRIVRELQANERQTVNAESAI